MKFVVEGAPTDRQREIFKLAVHSGHWEVPRRITLKERVVPFKISKSTLSKHVLSIEKKVIREIADSPMVKP